MGGAQAEGEGQGEGVDELQGSQEGGEQEDLSWGRRRLRQFFGGLPAFGSKPPADPSLQVAPPPLQPPAARLTGLAFVRMRRRTHLDMHGQGDFVIQGYPFASREGLLPIVY